MKKSNFIDGAFIATITIVLTKVLGILYVIPFYAIIGEHGGALYGYSYNIYNIFLIISAAGIPLAISKITSEYVALGKIKEKNYVYKVSQKFITVFSVVSFLICFFGAEQLAYIIIGDLTGGNSIEDIAFVIRCVSFALIVVPLLSVFRGFLQGHKYIATSSFSQFIEQLFRILVILVGSALAIYYFNWPIPIAVGISVFGAFVGAFIAYLYLRYKSRHLVPKKVVDDLTKIEKKEISKKIIAYSIPFIIVNLSFYLYTFIDTILIIRTLDYIGYNANDIELITSVFTTWGPKLISIVTAFASGMVISLIPAMVSSYVKKEMNSVNKQYSKAIEVLLIIILPISLFLSIYSKEVWTIFYGESFYGPIIFQYVAILTFFDSTYLIMGSILQNLNKNLLIYKKVLLGLGINVLLDVPLMLLFNELGIYPYYGAITATLIGYTLSVSFVIYQLHKEEKVIFNIKTVMPYVIKTVLVLVPINILLSLYTSEITSRITLLFVLSFIAIVSASIYLLINHKMIKNLLGRSTIFKKKQVT